MRPEGGIGQQQRPPSVLGANRRLAARQHRIDEVVDLVNAGLRIALDEERQQHVVRIRGPLRSTSGSRVGRRLSERTMPLAPNTSTRWS